MVANSVDEITIFPKENDDNAPYEIQDSGGTALTDADSVEDEFQVTLSVGDNTIKVEVTAEDGSTQTYTVTVTRAAGTPTAGVTVSKSALTVTEQDATGDSYTVVLNSRADGECHGDGRRVHGLRRDAEPGQPDVGADRIWNTAADCDGDGRATIRTRWTKRSR